MGKDPTPPPFLQCLFLKHLGRHQREGGVSGAGDTMLTASDSSLPLPHLPTPARHLFKQVGQHQGRKAGEGVSTGDSSTPSPSNPLPSPPIPPNHSMPMPRSQGIGHGVVQWEWGKGFGYRLRRKESGSHIPELKRLSRRVVVTRVRPRRVGRNALRIPPVTLILT